MSYDAERYIELGMEGEVARYFAAGRPQPVSVRTGDGRFLLITFEDGAVRKFDVDPLIAEGTVFSFLRDEDAFSRAYIDSDGAVAWDRDPSVDSSAVWTNKVDLSPELCYVDGEPVATE